MASYGKFLTHVIRLVMYCAYPILELYGYFVFCGLYCLEGTFVGRRGAIIFFLVYNLITFIKIIFYLELFVIEDKSTIDLFPETGKNDHLRTFGNINPYVVEDMLGKPTDQVKTCSICKTYKPPRTHHSLVKNKCYLKYDHYCPFFYAAIGYHNYKFFYQFMIINFVSSSFFITIIFLDLFNDTSEKVITVIVNYIISLALFIIVFLVYLHQLILHTYLISNNETLLENIAINNYLAGDYSSNHIFQEGPIKLFSSSRDRRVLNPYNLGCR